MVFDLKISPQSPSRNNSGFYGMLIMAGTMQPKASQNNTDFTEKAKATEFTESKHRI